MEQCVGSVRRGSGLLGAVAIGGWLLACSAEPGPGAGAGGGVASNGGNGAGGAGPSGGSPTVNGGATSGGASSTGGALGNAGSASGGATSGGASSGGASSGGASSGGNAGTASSGGSSNGGSSNGGSTSGGSGAGGQAKGGSAGSSSGGSSSGGTASSGGAPSTGGAAGAASGGSGGAITVPTGYKLVWHDEFDVDGAPNPANWKYETGFVRNEEAQWYQAKNASVKAGLLTIEGRRERVQNPNYTGSGDWKTTRQYAEYTSTSMHTNGLQTFQYGRFEMRGRIPTAAGMWPAWWTLGVSGEWPSNGEIDIMEFYNNKVLANVACGTATRWQAKWASQTRDLASLGGATWASQFHVWRMDWDDQRIVLYLDDQQLNNVTLSSMLNADGTSPFKQKDYMLLNLAIGGVNGGNPANTTFPQRFEVDYVRVFQKQ